MSFDLDIPIWAILLFFLVTLIVPFSLSGVGIYYFVSKKFSTTALIISAIIFFSLVVIKLINSWKDPLNINLNFLGMPFSGFAAFMTGGFSILFYLIGMALNYFALFSVVNFGQRIFRKVNS